MRAAQQHDGLVRGLQKVFDGRGWRAALAIFVGGVCGSDREEGAAAANIEAAETLGVAEGRAKRHEKATCVEIAGGAGSSAEELLGIERGI